MRIISNFHDYYDSVQSYGQDRSVIYHRKTEDVPIEIKELENFYLFKYDSRELEIDYFFVSFCGILYLGFRISDKFLYNFFYEYDVSKLELFLKNNHTESYNYFMKKEKERGLYNRSICKERIIKHKKELEKIKMIDLHIQLNSPVILITKGIRTWKSEYNISINPNLKELCFYKAVDPFNAYQNIFQFIGGILVTKGKEMPIISNEDKIQKSGFDKWSFRKEPANK